MNLVTLPSDPTRKYVIVSTSDGKVDIIEKGDQNIYKQLPIDMVQCSIQIEGYLLIGAASKLYLVDINNDFAMCGHIGLTRHVFCICQMSSF